MLETLWGGVKVEKFSLYLTGDDLSASSAEMLGKRRWEPHRAKKMARRSSEQCGRREQGGGLIRFRNIQKESPS